MKLKFVAAAALAIAAASPAMATIKFGDTSTAELFLIVGNANQSVVVDSGITLQSFVDAAAAGTNPFPINLSLAGNAAWNSFLAPTNGVISADTQWAFAAISNYAAAASELTFLSTLSSANKTNIGGIDTFNFKSSLQFVNFPVTNANATGTHTSAANGSSFNLKGTNAYVSPQAFALNASKVQIGNKVNDTASFVVVTGSQEDDSLPVDVQTFSNVTAKFDGTTLTVGVAAAVPEPESYALMLAGLVAVGFVARRRRAA